MNLEQSNGQSWAKKEEERNTERRRKEERLHSVSDRQAWGTHTHTHTGKYTQTESALRSRAPFLWRWLIYSSCWPKLSVTNTLNSTSAARPPVISTLHHFTSILTPHPHSSLRPPLPTALSLWALNLDFVFFWMRAIRAIRLSLFSNILFGPWLWLRWVKNSSWTYLWEESWIPITVWETLTSIHTHMHTIWEAMHKSMLFWLTE